MYKPIYSHPPPRCDTLPHTLWTTSQHCGPAHYIGKRWGVGETRERDERDERETNDER